MESRASNFVEFYMTICPCGDKDANHRSEHNSFVATRVAELISYVGNISKGITFDASSCCIEEGDKLPSHKKHYVIICISESVLEYTTSLLNQGFSLVLSNENNVGRFTNFILTTFINLWFFMHEIIFERLLLFSNAVTVIGDLVKFFSSSGAWDFLLNPRRADLARRYFLEVAWAYSRTKRHFECSEILQKL